MKQSPEFLKKEISVRHSPNANRDRRRRESLNTYRIFHKLNFNDILANLRKISGKTSEIQQINAI